MPAKSPTSGSATPGRKRDAERTSRSIMAAAQKEFSRQGYAGARIEKIALDAKCNIRMLYHYFGSKKNLYGEVLEAAYADIRYQESRLNIDIDKPLEGLVELLRFTFDYFERNPGFEGLLRAENMIQGKFVRKSAHIPESAFPLRKTIAELIDSGQKKGVLRDNLDPVHIYVTITALSRFHLANAFSLSALLETDMTRRDWRRERWIHSVEILRAYLTTPVSDERRPADDSASNGDEALPAKVPARAPV